MKYRQNLQKKRQNDGRFISIVGEGTGVGEWQRLAIHTDDSNEDIMGLIRFLLGKAVLSHLYLTILKI